MSKTIKNEETGEEEEVFTAEELQAERESAVEKYKEENPVDSAKISKLEEDLRLANEKLNKADDKDKNFTALRQAKIDAEKKLAEVLEGVNKDHYIDTLKTLAGDDEDLKKKIEFHYKRLADPSSTKGEITSKLKDAYTLATGQSAESMNSSAYSSAGANRPKTKSPSEKLNADEKALAKKIALAGGMKLDDKDFG